MSDITPLGIAALALLVERPMHPYEMYQVLLHRREDRNVKIRPGSLYHTVDRLAEAGLVEAVGVDRAGNRPERTTYSATDAGRQSLTERITSMLATPAQEYPEFRLAIAEAHSLPAGTAVALLTRRREALAEQLAALEESRRRITEIGLPVRFWLDAGYQLAMLQADLAWLDTTITEIVEGRLSWTDPVPEHLRENI